MPACPTPPVIDSFGVSEEVVPKGDSVTLTCEVNRSNNLSSSTTSFFFLHT